jgi:hypothetical protein
MSKARDALMAAWEAENAIPRKRGRPRADTLGDLEGGMRRFAIEVFILELMLGRRRGDLTKATRRIAVKRRLDYENLRKAVQRHRDLRSVADLHAMLDRQEAEWTELRRRMRNFPADVRRLLGPLPASRVLAILRREGIDGDDLMSQRSSE